MTVTLHGIRNCDTVKKARLWLEGQGVEHAFHDFKTQGVSDEQLACWSGAVGWEKLLNRAGTTFRKLPEAERADLSQDKALALMKAAPSMIKRPVLQRGDAVLVGFKPEDYARFFG
jgi:Spx/MgsR family transcriptional regulator